jgi:phosphoribosylamine-glycine ligase
MVPIVQRQVQEFDAEAVCVISNPVLTARIVYELESRGIPAFGPIFDS